VSVYVPAGSVLVTSVATLFVIAGDPRDVVPLRKLTVPVAATLSVNEVVMVAVSVTGWPTLARAVEAVSVVEFGAVFTDPASAMALLPLVALAELLAIKRFPE
jgi:hypothetical protein